jgi:hypothetical protein
MLASRSHFNTPWGRHSCLPHSAGKNVCRRFETASNQFALWQFEFLNVRRPCQTATPASCAFSSHSRMAALPLRPQRQPRCSRAARAAQNLGGEFCAFRHFTRNPPKTTLNPSCSEPNTAGWSMHRIPKQAICGSRARDDVFPNLIPFCHTRLRQCRYLLRTYEKPERAKAANNGIKNRVVRTSPQSNHPSCWAQ